MMQLGPISPLPWRAVYPDNPLKGCIRILDANGKDVGIDGFPTRPSCNAEQVAASVAAMIDIVNAFWEREQA